MWDRIRAWVRGARPAGRAVREEGWSRKSADERWHGALEAAGFWYQILEGPGAEAAWTEARAVAERTTPILVVPGHWNPVVTAAEARIACAARHTADPVRGRRCLRERRAELLMDFDDIDGTVGWTDLFAALRPRPIPPSSPARPYAFDRWDPQIEELVPWPAVAILHVPTPHPYEVPLYLSWGGWNAVPSSEELVDILAYWQERWGAELVAVSSDTLELTVPRHPDTHQAAVELMEEHHAFAEESVPWDRETIEAHTAGLRSTRRWFFWWD